MYPVPGVALARASRAGKASAPAASNAAALATGAAEAMEAAEEKEQETKFLTAVKFAVMIMLLGMAYRVYPLVGRQLNFCDAS